MRNHEKIKANLGGPEARRMFRQGELEVSAACQQNEVCDESH
jgi:hypothetical protein